MSVTVCNGNGVVQTYRRADWIKWGEQPGFAAALYRGEPSKNGEYLASIPSGWTISFDTPLVQHLGKPPELTVAAAVGIVEAALENISGYPAMTKLVNIKKRLRKLDARTHCWKGK